MPFKLPHLVGLRANTLKISPENFSNLSPFKLSPVGWCISGFIITSGIEIERTLSPGKHPYHSAGLYYLQEPSAMAAAEILAPQPGESVLDLAAAPGGKATHLANLMDNTGVLVTNEIHPKRVWDLVENLERCGVTNAIVTNDSPEKLADHFGEYFDRILLDAPCSGEGMFRKSSTARQEWNTFVVKLRHPSISHS
jgi:16S rRNA C967 or C1407 C5-methylase (RsmB/RsmF family)